MLNQNPNKPRRTWDKVLVCDADGPEAVAGHGLYDVGDHGLLVRGGELDRGAVPPADEVTLLEHDFRGALGEEAEAPTLAGHHCAHRLPHRVESVNLQIESWEVLFQYGLWFYNVYSKMPFKILTFLECSLGSKSGNIMPIYIF